MDRQRLKFLLLGVGVVAAMGILLAVALTGDSGFSYYRSVSEFRADPGTDAQMRVNGKVEVGSIRRADDGSEVDFVMHEGGQTLTVHYAGIIPDTFVDDADVVVQGELDADGVFQADLLLAKCPSKYEAEEGYGEEGYADTHGEGA